MATPDGFHQIDPPKTPSEALYLALGRDIPDDGRWEWRTTMPTPQQENPLWRRDDKRPTVAYVVRRRAITEVISLRDAPGRFLPSGKKIKWVRIWSDGSGAYGIGGMEDPHGTPRPNGQVEVLR